MARIRNDEILTFTRDEATRFIRNIDGRVVFFVRLGTELPIVDEPGRVFPGSGLLEVSRRQAIESVRSLLSETLEERGGRLRIHTSPSEYDSTRAYVFIG